MNIAEFYKTYFYLCGSLSLLPFWLPFFLQKKYRNEMIFIGLLSAFSALIIGKLYATKDYWHPNYFWGTTFNIEDFIYGFLYGGLGTVLFDFIAKTKIKEGTYKKRWGYLPLFIGFEIACFVILVDVAKFNSIVAHITPLLTATIIMCFIRKDLVKAALLSGTVFMVFTFLWYKLLLLGYPTAIEDIWYTHNLFPVYFLGIPFEELLFAYSLGAGASIYFKFASGQSYRKISLL